MPRRKIVLATGEIYHLFNRSIAHQPIFTRTRDNTRFLETIDFYRFQNPMIRFSHFNRLPQEQKKQFYDKLKKESLPIVEIFAFCLIPNHFHILARQLQENGIKNFLSQIQNSYAKFYNTKYDRSGALFQEMFKAVRIET